MIVGVLGAVIGEADDVDADSANSDVGAAKNAGAAPDERTGGRLEET